MNSKTISQITICATFNLTQTCNINFHSFTSLWFKQTHSVQCGMFHLWTAYCKQCGCGPVHSIAGSWTAQNCIVGREMAVRSDVCSRVLRQRRYLQISHGTAFTFRPLYNAVFCYKPHSTTVNSHTSVRDWFEYSVYCVILTDNKMATQHTNI